MVHDERVLASELIVGDEVYFPNSRTAQKIESIVDEAGTEQHPAQRKLMTTNTTWVVTPEAGIRKK